MRRIETYELIERYLLGKTGPDENAEIESRIKNDPSFAEELEQHRNMQQVINDFSLLDVRETLSSIRKRKQISIKRRNKFYRSVLIVGSCAIIVSLSLLYIFNNNDGAVRRASEAPEASEALTDTLVSADKAETATVQTKPSEASYQKDEDAKSLAQDQVSDNDAASDLLPKAVPDLISGDSSTIAATDLPPTAVPDLPETAAPDLLSGANYSPDLQSGDSTNLQSAAPCNIKADYVAQPSCNNKATGIIRIIESTLISGTPPYQAVLNGEYSDSLIFKGLKPGFYRLEIRDASGCLVNLGTVFVDTKDCRYQENFYPLLELWKIPLDNQSGIIEIWSKNGLPVYHLRFDGAGKEYWNGNDLNNRALPMGLYFFRITYDNGNVFEGDVTISR